MLNKYDFTVKYIPGKENVIADYLSCMKRQEADISEEEIEGRVLAVQRDANERITNEYKKFHMWSIDELIQRQSEDSVVQEIKKIVVEEGQNGKQRKKIKGYPIKDMHVEENILYV